MGNISDKSCSENQHTYFMPNNGFSKIVPFVRYVKNIVEQASDDKMAHVNCMLPT